MKKNIDLIINELVGLPRNEWDVLKEIVDREYNKKAAKVQLDGQSVEAMRLAIAYSPIQSRSE